MPTKTNAKRTIEQVEVKSKRVLMRVDFNVPLNEKGEVTDDLRIRASLPSIQSVINRGGRLILISHLGRPEGTGFEEAYSLKPAAAKLEQLLGGTKVTFIGEDCLSEAAQKAVADLKDGQVLMLENLRFHAGEKDGSVDFAKRLALYGDIFCNEAFGASHREDASMVALPEAMSGKPRVAGVLLQKELMHLSTVVTSPKHPFVAVLGGAKVSDKIVAVRRMMENVDTILVGGAMAYTFLKALGRQVGSSKVENGMLDTAKKILDEAASSKVDLILPQDHICGKQIARMTPTQVFANEIEAGWMGLDIGPKTAAQYAAVLGKAKSVVWNGPMGVFETPPFDGGSKQIARAIAGATAGGATTVVGGGDTAAAVQAFGLADGFTHVSTGGGASLAVLEGQDLKAVAVLDEAD